MRLKGNQHIDGKDFRYIEKEFKPGIYRTFTNQQKKRKTTQ